MTPHTARSPAARPAGGPDCTTIAFSQLSSSTSRTTARAAVLSPVGRYGVAKNVACSAATASSDAATASSCSAARLGAAALQPGDLARATVRASARQAAIAAMRTGSRAGAGHSSAIASSDTPEARPQPASRSGIAEGGRGQRDAAG